MGANEGSLPVVEPFAGRARLGWRTANGTATGGAACPAGPTPADADRDLQRLGVAAVWWTRVLRRPVAA